MDLESVWELREEEIYPALFGPSSRGIFTLGADAFGRFAQDGLHPRWMTYGVLEHSPTPDRASWVYVTSGHSNPWEEEPDEYSPDNRSGQGVEFVLETARQADWAIFILHRVLAFDILLFAGRYEGASPLAIGDRFPAGGARAGSDTSKIQNFIMIRPPVLDDEFTLPSGKVNLIEVFGATDEEVVFAREHGHDSLITKLSTWPQFPATDLDRQSIV